MNAPQQSGSGFYKRLQKVSSLTVLVLDDYIKQSELSRFLFRIKLVILFYNLYNTSHF